MTGVQTCALPIYWGDCLHDLGQRQAGLAKVDEAVRLGEALLAKEPKLEQARTSLRIAYAARGKAKINTNRPLEASQDFDRAIELSLESERLPFRWLRLPMLPLAHRYTFAAEEARALAVHGSPSAAQWFLLAEVWVHCAPNAWRETKLSDAERLAFIQESCDQTLACLAKARAAGYFDDPARASKLRSDTAFLPVYLRPEFQRLCAEIEADARNRSKK